MAAKRKEAATEGGAAAASRPTGRRLCRIASTNLGHNGRYYPIGSEAEFTDAEIASLPHILIPVES